MGHSSSVSPLAPKKATALKSMEGVGLAVAQAGIRYKNRIDALLVQLPEDTQCAGVFTKSLCPSAAVDWCRAHVGGSARALLVNSGNANAFTGQKGVDAVELSAKLVAQELGIKSSEVLLASTGVIGEPLDASKFEAVLPALNKGAAADAWSDAAHAIMTTDTFPKTAKVNCKIGDVEITLQGFAKGAGMIAPDMATMLAFVFTDAQLPADVMQSALKSATQETFNCITVDSDTSTSDTILMFATGKAKHEKVVSATDKHFLSFKRALKKLLGQLAELVVRDGEGARKLIKIEVRGAASKRAAKRVALSIANSPLVKTAVAGEDANWGRIVMAVGKAGEKAQRDQLSIFFGNIRVAHLGMRDAHYDEGAVSALMKKQVIEIGVDLGIGRGKAKVLTCDLTKEYVAINGDYRS